MRRRELLGALMLPCLAQAAAAQGKARIAILHSGFPNRTPIEIVRAHHPSSEGEAVSRLL